MNELIERSWWMFALRGAVALLFGILAAALPGLTLLWLVALFAAYALIGGAVSVYAAVRKRRSSEDWWLVLILGLVSVGAGILSVLHPDLTALVLVLLMAANALLVGVLDIALAIRMRKSTSMRSAPLLIVTGIVSIAFGVLVFLFPAAGALALVWLISLYAIVTGVLLLVLAFRVRARPEAAAGPSHTFSPG